MTMPEFEAFILIGGRSSRIGRDKALIDLGGETLARRATETVRRGLSAERITMVAGSSTQFAIEAIVADTPFIFDLYDGRGPLGGIHAALSYAKTSWIFVLACDYPFVSPEMIKFLADQVSAEYSVVVPEQKDGRVQALCGFYEVETARPIVETILERPSVPPPMHKIVAEMNPRIVKFDHYSHLSNSENFFLNINTVEDLEIARGIV